jgi:tetratricopeptide (TPR) repeat protein
MIARKLSIVALHKSGRLVIVTLACTLFIGTLRAEGEVRVSKPGAVVPNPFAPGAQRPESVAVESAAPHRGPVTYHNPFPRMSTAPPINLSALPGPISRWRRPTPPLGASSGVKTAILSTEPSKPLRPNWDQLPPTEQLIADGAQKPSSAGADSARPEHEQKGSTIRFAPESLTQPAWLSEPREPVRPLPEPVDQALAGESPIHSTPEEAVASQDPFDIAASVPAEPPATARLDVGATTPAISSGVPRPAPADVDPMPLVISDYADSPEGWLAEAQHLAQTAKSLEDLKAVTDLCQRALSHGPRAEVAAPVRRLAGWAHNRCGELLVDSGQHAEALRNFQVAVALDPSSSLAIHNRAVTLAQQNDVEAALRDFNRVIELNPGLSVAYRNRAELLASLGRVGEAVRDYSRAIDGLPDDPHLYQARGAAWQRLGDFEQAQADLNQAIKLAPESADAYTQRGNLAAEQGDFQQAISDLHQAIAKDPLWAEAYRSLAWLHATCPEARYRDPGQAIAAAEQAVKLAGPADCFVLDAFAAAQASAGQFDEAVEIQEQAITAAPPDYAEALRARLSLYQQRQTYVAAKRDEVQPASHQVEISDQAE